MLKGRVRWVAWAGRIERLPSCCPHQCCPAALRCPPPRTNAHKPAVLAVPTTKPLPHPTMWDGAQCGMGQGYVISTCIPTPVPWCREMESRDAANQAEIRALRQREREAAQAAALVRG